MDASASDPGVRRSRAIRLLNTTTMQNVVCPMMMVRVPSWTPVKEKKEFSAIPVMMPGRASGSTSRNEMASRPSPLPIRRNNRLGLPNESDLDLTLIFRRS